MSTTRTPESLSAAASATLAHLTFELGNAGTPGAANTIYITTDKTVNKLVLGVTTDTDGVKFAPGTPVPQKQAGTATGSLLYLDLTNLQLTDAEFGLLTFDAPGWTITPYPEDQQLCLTPESSTGTVTLGKGGALSLGVDQLTITNPPSGATVQLTVTCYRIGEVTLGNMGRLVSLAPTLQQAPSGGGNLHDAIAVSVADPGIVCSTDEYPDVANTLRLILLPGTAPHAAAKAGTTFTLSFVYADPKVDPEGYGALTSTAAAMRFAVIRGAGASSWGQADPKDQENPAWLFTPPAGPLLPPTGSAQIEMSSIVTSFQPGPTMLILSYSGVEGYDDGSFVVPLEKYGHASISQLGVSPNPSILGDDHQAAIDISWTTAYAPTLTLGYDDVSGQTDEPTTIHGRTQFTLIAEGPTPSGTPNRATRDVTADVLPVIDEFVAEPFALYAKDFGRQVRLSWNVNTNGNVRLQSSVDGPDPNLYPAATSILKTLTRPQMETLVPVDHPADLQVQKSLLVSAFSPATPQVTPVSGGATFVAIAPTTGFVVVSSPSSNDIHALDTLVYQPAGSVTIGNQPGGMCFSPDGSLLYVVATGDSAVKVVKPSLGTTPPLTYSMSVVGTASVVGAPQQVATSPNGKFVYVTVDNGGTAGSLYVFQAGSNGSLTPVGQPLHVGLDPRGVAVSGSGAHVYVANSGDATVSIIGVGPGAQHTLVGRISKLGPQPTGLVVTQPGADDDDQGGILLVACAGANQVIAIDTEYPGTAPRQTLAVGSSPNWLTLVPGGAYAVAANSSAGTLSLLGLGPTTSACTVVEKAITAAAGIAGVAASPDAGLLVAASPQSSSVAVVALAEYAQQEDPVGVGGQPTDVAVSPDGTQVVSWHDWNSSFSMGRPGFGLSVLALSSSNVNQQLTSFKVIDFAYGTGPGAGYGFLLDQASAYLNAVNTSTWAPAGPVQLSHDPSWSSRHLAVSGDGKTVFALGGNAQHQYSLLAYTVGANAQLTPIGSAVQVFSSAQGSIVGLAAAPDGSAAYVLDGIHGKVWVLTRGTSGFTLGTAPVSVGPAAWTMAISSDGSRLFVLTRPQQNNTLTAIDLGDLTTRATVLPSLQNVMLNELVVSADGTKVLATDGLNVGLRVFDAASLRLVQTLSWQQGVQNPYGVAAMPDGSQIFTTNVYSNNLGVIQQVQPA